MQRHQTIRVRHETRRRILTVVDIEQLAPSMLRLGFTCPDLADFVSASADDHIKLFFPLHDRTGERPCMRDFTPRFFDTARGTLTIDFAIHDAGPATGWATSARIGDTLEIGGPRGSVVIADDFDWYLLIGDETALPAIGRRVEELRPGVPVTSLVLVNDGADEQQIITRVSWTPHWIVRRPDSDDSATLLAALADYRLPEGEGFVWIAAESNVARAVRSYVTDRLGHPKEWTKAAGYWTKGLADAHERIGD